MSKNKTDIMDRFKTISDSIRTNQIKAMKSMIERTDKKIDQKINEACKRIYEKVLEEIKGKLELIHDIDKVQTDIRELRKMTDDLIEKHTVLTEVSYIARNRLDKEGQARLNAELIRSMDFPCDWFKKRNDMSLNELFKMYQNGVDKGQ